MQFLLDNTGIHGAGRCFERSGKGEADLAGLLQLATQLVFCERLYVSAFESPEVEQRTNHVREFLISRGMDPHILEPISFDIDAYSTACQTAANLCAEDLAYALPQRIGDNLSIMKFFAPDLDVRRVISKEHDLLAKIINDEEVHTEADLLRHKAAHAVIYMLTKSPTLQSRIRAIKAKGDWTVIDTATLSVVLRTKLNEELARTASSADNSIVYAPAIPRARLVAKQGDYLIAKLSELVGEVAKELERRAIKAPSIADALARKSKGDPIGLLDEALVARDKARDLRDYLEKETAKTDQIGNKRHRERTAILDLKEPLQQYLGTKERPTLFDAFEASFLGFVPIPNPVKIKKWMNFQRRKKAIVLLGEFALVLVDDRVDRFYYDKLWTATCGDN